MSNIKNLKRELNGEFLEIFKTVEGRLDRSIGDRDFFKETLEELYGMLYTCQVEGRNIESILPEGAEGFIDEIEGTYFRGIPKGDVFLGLLAKIFTNISIFTIIFYVTYFNSKLVLYAIPTGTIYALIMHFVFGRIKNSKLRSTVDFLIYLMTYVIIARLFRDAITIYLSPVIIFSIIAGTAALSLILSSRKKLLMKR